MYWIGLQPGDVHLNISSPGWAKHAWSCFFAPWNAGATVFIYNYARFNAKAVLDAVARCGVTTLCAPPTVWRMLIQEDLGSFPVKLREVIGAGEPLNPEVIEQVQKAWGLTMRDGYGQTETTAQIGNSPGQTVEARLDGPAAAGLPGRAARPRRRRGAEGEIALRLDPRPPGLMLGYQDDPAKTAQVTAGGYYRTGDVADARRRRLHHLRRPRRRRVQGVRLPDQPVRAGERADRARGGRRGRRGAEPGPAAPGRAEGVRDAGRGLRSRAPSWPRTSCASPAARLAPYKRIRRLEFAELPKTISGKIRRVELRKHEDEMRKAGRARRAGVLGGGLPGAEGQRLSGRRCGSTRIETGNACSPKNRR